MSADAPEVRRATNPATSLAGSEATGFLGSDRKASRSETMTSQASIKMPIGAAKVCSLGDCDGDDRNLRPAQVVEICLVIGSGMHRRECADQLESVSFAAAGDQGVEAVLRERGRLRCRVGDQ